MAHQQNGNKADVYVIPCESNGKLQKELPRNLNKEMLRYKCVFFFHNGGLAAAFFYIAVIAKEHVGLTSSSLAAVLSAQMFLFIFTKPVIGFIADFFNNLKITICALTILNLICFFSLFAIPKIEKLHWTNSSSILKENLCNRTELCNKCDFLQISQNTTNCTLMDFSDLNMTGSEFPFQSCLICYLQNESCYNILSSFFTANNAKDTIDNRNNDGKQNCGVSCKENSLFSCNNHSTQDSFYQNFSNCVEAFCLQNLELNKTVQTLKDGFAFKCSSNLSDILNSSLSDLSEVGMRPPLIAIVNSCSAENMSENRCLNFKKREVSDFYTYQFWIFALLFTISNICENANFTLVDTACCESIEKTKADFGKLRLWGNVGWGFFSPIGGLLNDYTGGFLASTALMSALLLSFLYNITKLDLVKPHYSKTICHDTGTIFRSKDFLFFEVVNLLNGIGLGITWFYLVWFLTSLGASKLLFGLSVFVQSFGGVIPVMFFSGWIIKKIGYYQIVIFTLLVYGLRFLFYSQLYTPWWVLPIELTHGITYGLYYATLATYGKLKAKPGTEATTQSILFTTHEGLGAGIGCGFAGVGFDYFGTHQTFFILSGFFGCNFIISLLLYFFIARKQKRSVAISA